MSVWVCVFMDIVLSLKRASPVAPGGLARHQDNGQRPPKRPTSLSRGLEPRRTPTFARRALIVTPSERPVETPAFHDSGLWGSCLLASRHPMWPPDGGSVAWALCAHRSTCGLAIRHADVVHPLPVPSRDSKIAMLACAYEHRGPAHARSEGPLFPSTSSDSAAVNPMQSADARQPDGEASAGRASQQPAAEHEPIPAAPAPATLSPRVHAHLEPLSPRRYRLQLTADSELRRNLELALDLLRHTVPGGNLATIIDRALELLIEKTMWQRFGRP